MSWATTPCAAPTVGFVENFPGTTTSTWGGGATISNPGTGGIGGAADGYLLVSQASPFNLGTKSNGPEYTGNWVAAGVTHVRLWLKDVGTNEPLEIHFGIGRDNLIDPKNPNFWQYNVGLIPPDNVWGAFDVDLTSTNWTRLHGTATLADALQNAKTIHLRHDLAPYVSNPDPIAGDFGLDGLELTNGPAGVPVPTGGHTRPVELAAPFPNPSRGEVTLALETFAAGPVHLEIVDAGGRIVRRAELAGGVGRRAWTWDGANDRGRRLAPGSYRARAWNAFGGTSRPLILVR